MCALAFASDSSHLLFANKFGDVNVTAVGASPPFSPAAFNPYPYADAQTLTSAATAAGTGAGAPPEPRFVLGHWNSIVTSLHTSVDGRAAAATCPATRAAAATDGAAFAATADASCSQATATPRCA